MWLWLLVGFVASFGALFGFAALLRQRRARNILSKLAGKHVLITGGSEGIGKAMAIICAQHGASVTLFARNPQKLDAAKREIKQQLKSPEQQQVNALPVDVTSADEVQRQVDYVLRAIGPVQLLINCAGNSVPDYFENLQLDTFRQMMDVNYFGSVYTTKALLDCLKSEAGSKKDKCHLVFVSSVAGVMGLFGFSAYSPAKFAVVGLAQCLKMELHEHNVSVTVVLPPDTDTPGFENEQKTKPIETKKISESGGLCKPEQVAEQALKDALMGKFTSTVGFENKLVCLAGSGTNLTVCMFKLLLDTLLIGFARFAVGVFLMQCMRIVRQCKLERDIKEKSK